MNMYRIIIIGFILFSFLLNLVVERLNLGRMQTSLPDEFSG